MFGVQSSFEFEIRRLHMAQIVFQHKCDDLPFIFIYYPVYKPELGLASFSFFFSLTFHIAIFLTLNGFSINAIPNILW